MISDKLSIISGRQKDIAEITRLLNKNVNVLITGERYVGKTYVLWGVYENFANSPWREKRIIYLKGHGTRRDLEQIIFYMSRKYSDIHDPDCREQSFPEFRKGSQQQLERRILTGIKNSSGQYLLFIEEKKKLPDTMRIFLDELLKTGKVAVIAEPKEMSDSKTRQFYQGFDSYIVRRINDERMAALYDYFVSTYSVKIRQEDYREIRKKLLAEVAGNPGRLKEKFERGMKEREIKKDEILEKYPSSHRKEYPFGMSLMLLVVFAMGYRYYLRGLGTVSDMVAGGAIFSLALLFYKISSRFK
ncbi:hypothetical protein KAR91_39260 [Candidatus Pacearchaeota archaeon]|nr:hypothetical protein [Candidatus Pacearchaeota archaeon]